jgi:Ni/Co efflux regulator RcnB
VSACVSQTRTPIVSNIPREGTQPPLRTQHSVRHDTHWTTEWRNDRRYDWRHWRDRHRSSFHLGFYYDPFGWNYRRYSIGWRLWPSYYSSSFWINDPWQYRLPYAPPGYRWIRYYDDAILVDTFSGEVVDVLYNFFW